MHVQLGTGGLNVPMFIALRRFTLLCTIVLERLMYHKKHDPSTYGAVTTMIIGATHFLGSATLSSSHVHPDGSHANTVVHAGTDFISRLAQVKQVRHGDGTVYAAVDFDVDTWWWMQGPS